MDLVCEFIWIGCYCNYLPGSALFLDYLPSWCVTLGAWMFVIGSVCCVTASWVQMIVFFYLNVKVS